MNKIRLDLLRMLRELRYVTIHFKCNTYNNDCKEQLVTIAKYHKVTMNLQLIEY